MSIAALIRGRYIILMLNMFHEISSHTDGLPTYTTSREKRPGIKFGYPWNDNPDCHVLNHKLDNYFGWLSPYDVACPSDPLGAVTCCWCMWDQEFIERIGLMQAKYDSYERKRREGRLPHDVRPPYKPPVIDPRTYHAPLEVDQLFVARTSRYALDDKAGPEWTPVSFRCRVTLNLDDWAEYWPASYHSGRAKNKLPLVTRQYRFYCRPDELWQPIYTASQRQYNLLDPQGDKVDDRVASGYCKISNPAAAEAIQVPRRIERVPHEFKVKRKGQLLPERAKYRLPRDGRGRGARPVLSRHTEVAPGSHKCTELIDLSQHSDQDLVLIARAETKNTIYDRSHSVMHWPESQLAADIPQKSRLESSSIETGSKNLYHLDSGLPAAFDHNWPELNIKTGDLFTSDQQHGDVPQSFDPEREFRYPVVEDSARFDDRYDPDGFLQHKGQFLADELDMWPELQIDPQTVYSDGKPGAEPQRDAHDMTIRRLETVPPARLNTVSIVAGSPEASSDVQTTRRLSHGVGPSNRIYYEIPATRKRPGSDIDRNMQSSIVSTEFPSPQRSRGTIKACLDHGGSTSSSQSASFYAELLFTSLDVGDAFDTIEFPSF